MPGIGTVINVAAILAGGTAGLLFGKIIRSQVQDGLCTACGIATLFLGLAGAMEGMLSAQDGKIVSGGTMLVIGCLVLGALVGELLNLEDKMERFGQWLKEKTGNAGDGGFVDAFVTASLTVCIGAMAIVGSIQDGIRGELFHSDGQGGAGFHSGDGDDLLDGQGLPLFRHPGGGVPGEHHSAGRAGCPTDDRRGAE